MTDKQEKELHAEIAAVLKKHGVKTMVGMWFKGRTTGIIEIFDPKKPFHKLITAALAVELRVNARRAAGVKGSKNQFTYRPK